LHLLATLHQGRDLHLELIQLAESGSGLSQLLQSRFNLGGFAQCLLNFLLLLVEPAQLGLGLPLLLPKLLLLLKLLLLEFLKLCLQCLMHLKFAALGLLLGLQCLKLTETLCDRLCVL